MHPSSTFGMSTQSANFGSTLVTNGSNSTKIMTRWSNVEDRALISAMNDLLDLGGWKADNGQFKSGAYAKLEALLEKKLPGCGKKAKPHIESRVKLLRKQYEAISEMLSPSASGFGWNDESKFVTCPESMWVDWLKSHPNAKGLRNKSFPFYDELGRVFGKDRAVGNEAENVYDALEQMEGARVAEEQEVLETNVEQVLTQSNAADTPTSTDSTPTSTIPSARRTKKARTETLEAFKDLSSNLGKMTEAIESATNHIGRLASCFQHESDSTDRRMKVMSEVMKIEQLTPGEVILVSRKIALNPPEVDFFFSMPQDYRYTYVQGLLIPDLRLHNLRE